MDPRQTKRRGRRPALLAASLAACALGSVPALAQLPPGPDVTVPLPLQEGTEGSGPASTTTTTAPTTTSTAPLTSSTTTPTTLVRTHPPLGSSSVSSEPPDTSELSGSTDGGPSPQTTRRSAANARRSTSSRPVPAAGTETFDVAPAAAEQAPTIARLRQVTLPAARQFGFPLGLAALVLAFLAVQGRLDARDPKLAIAPLSVDDDLLPFS